MLLESDDVLMALDRLYRRAMKVHDTGGKQPYDAGRAEGLKAAYCLIESLASGKEDCTYDPDPL
ncbi:MAG TPA: hypothetical protein VMC79_03745 [Rectinemataceae bacterium]|nr:hypothetical protein [Rectinemataceae bacterium]